MKSLSRLTALAAVLFGVLGSLHGGTEYTWSRPGNGDWGDSANWTPTGVPGVGDTAKFSGTARTIAIEADHEVERIEVTGSGAWTWIGYDNAASNKVWEGTNTLTVAEEFDYQSSGNSTFSAKLAGAGKVTKSVGTGLLTLSLSDNTFAGGVTVHTGRIRAGDHSDEQYPPTFGPFGTGDVVLKDGTSISGTITATRWKIYNRLVIDGDITFYGAGYYTIYPYGPILLTGDRTFTNISDSDMRFYGEIQDGGNNYKLTYGPGTAHIILQGRNTYGGGTVVDISAGRNFRVGVDSDSDPFAGGPFGTGPVSFVSGDIMSLNNQARVIANPVTVDGDIRLGAGDTYYGSLTFTAPMVLTGDRTITMLQNTSGHTMGFVGGITDNGEGYRLTVRGWWGWPRLGGAVSVSGGVHLEDAEVSVMPGATITTPIALDEYRAFLRLENTDGDATTTLSEVTFDASIPWVWLQGNQGGTWIINRLIRGPSRPVLTLTGHNISTTHMGPYYNQLQSGDILKVSNPPTVVDGMVAPYFIEATGDFLTYNAGDRGFQRVIYDVTNDINTYGGIHTVTSSQTLGGDNTVAALRAGANISGSGTLSITSGGLSITGSRTLEPDFDFGSAEAIVRVSSDSTATFNGALTGSNGFTKVGPGTVTLNGAFDVEGPIVVHEGTVKASNGLSDKSLLITGVGVVDLDGQDAQLTSLTMRGGYVRNNNASGNSTITLLGNKIKYEAASVAGYIQATDKDYENMTLALTQPTVFDIGDGTADRDLWVGYMDGNSDHVRPVIITGTDTPIIKRGAGILHLHGNSTFTGGVIIEEGGVSPLSVQNKLTETPLGDTSNNLVLRHNGYLYLDRANGTDPDVNGRLIQDLEFSGANSVTYNNGSTSAAFVPATLTRKGRGVLTLQGSSGNSHFGSNGRFYVDAWKDPSPPQNVNGIIAPYIVLSRAWSAGEGYFGRVLANTGQVTEMATSGGGVSTSITSGDAAQVLYLSGDANMTSNREYWALRTSGGITEDDDYTLTLGSGGAIFNNDATVDSKLKFGSSGDAEAVVYVAGGRTSTRSVTLRDTLESSVGLTKFGGGTLVLEADSSATLKGDHWVLGGTLKLANESAFKSDAEVNIERGSTVEIAGDYELDHAFAGLGTIATGANTLTMTGSLTPGFADDVGPLVVGNLDFRGTLNWQFESADRFDVVECDTLVLGDGAAKTVNADWIGDGEVPAGEYPVFTYKVAAPAFNLNEWTLKQPRGAIAKLRHDVAGKRIVLDIDEAPRGMIIIIR